MHASPDVSTFTSSSGSPGAFTCAPSVTECATCSIGLQSTGHHELESVITIIIIIVIIIIVIIITIIDTVISLVSIL